MKITIRFIYFKMKYDIVHNCNYKNKGMNKIIKINIDLKITFELLDQIAYNF